MPSPELAPLRRHLNRIARNVSMASSIETTTLSIPSSIDSFCIPIKVRQPSRTATNSSGGLKSIAIFIHGGIFTHGSSDCHPSIASALAEHNVVITVSFRSGSEAVWQSGVTLQDLRDVVEWVERERSERREWSDLMLGLVGSSSGGFFALTLAQTLPKHKISFCIPICPVAHPFKRASYLRSSISCSAVREGFVCNDDEAHSPSKAETILETQLGFWQDDTSMIKAGEALQNNTNNVPTLLIIGSKDKNVPFEVTRMIQSWATRTIVVGGRGHEICDSVEGIKGTYHDYISDVERFLDYVLEQRETKTC